MKGIMSFPELLLMALLVATSTAFTVNGSIGNSNHFGIIAQTTLGVRNAPKSRPSIRFLAKDGSDDWDSTEKTETPSGVDPSLFPKDSLSKKKELESLRSQMAIKSSSSSKSDGMPSNNNTGRERDLFIPILSVVSLAGLFGAYGYEMLRLYSRGELYLPGM
mmetsp:Transcript_20622/g.31314  ORF Transcript_20622/g.31314 Transcript_20622/m.31314 type:complete len:162 (-) Transcript_20622:151-636(-)